MKIIVHINASYKPAYIYGGPTISVSSLCENLAVAGEKTLVLTTTANGKSDLAYKNNDSIFIAGVEVHYFKRLTKDHSHFSPFLLLHLFRNTKQYSVIHIHAWWNLVSVGAAFVCWLKGKQFVFSPRGQLSNYSFTTNTTFLKRWFHKIIGKQILKKACFLVSSEKEARDVQKLFPDATTGVIANYINLAGVQTVNPSIHDEGVLNILFFSRIEQKKGLNFLLDSLSNLNFKFKLNIYGEGDLKYVDELKSKMDHVSSSNVYWNGSIYGDTKFQVFANADLLVLPSYDENFANTVVESLAVGTAVMLTKNVGMFDYVEEKSFGWACEQDANDIAQKLTEINKMRHDLKRIRQEAPSAILKDFGAKNLTDQYLNFYNLTPAERVSKTAPATFTNHLSS